MNTTTIRAVVKPLLTSGTMADRVAALNSLREMIAEFSPFADEPVDFVRWVPADDVTANDYNPNSVAPPEMEHYRDKILLFEKWWIERGYPDGIPDEAPYALEAKRLAPSWRRVCKALLRNDYWCKGLGFSQHKSAAYQKYQQVMKHRRERWGIDSETLGYGATGQLELEVSA